MRSFTSTITCINWFPLRINENDKVIKTCGVNFPKDNMLTVHSKAFIKLLKLS